MQPIPTTAFIFYGIFQGIVALINTALDPVLEGVKLDLENLIFKMHSEDFSR